MTYYKAKTLEKSVGMALVGTIGTTEIRYWARVGTLSARRIIGKRVPDALWWSSALIIHAFTERLARKALFMTQRRDTVIVETVVNQVTIVDRRLRAPFVGDAELVRLLVTQDRGGQVKVVH